MEMSVEERKVEEWVWMEARREVPVCMENRLAKRIKMTHCRTEVENLRG